MPVIWQSAGVWQTAIWYCYVCNPAGKVCKVMAQDCVRLIWSRQKKLEKVSNDTSSWTDSFEKNVKIDKIVHCQRRECVWNMIMTNFCDKKKFKVNSKCLTLCLERREKIGKIQVWQLESNCRNLQKRHYLVNLLDFNDGDIFVSPGLNVGKFCINAEKRTKVLKITGGAWGTTFPAYLNIPALRAK